MATSRMSLPPGVTESVTYISTGAIRLDFRLRMMLAEQAAELAISRLVVPLKARGTSHTRSTGSTAVALGQRRPGGKPVSVRLAVSSCR